ncbi:MAG: hypothetical protein GF355_15130 [Candidatus Eisenbacteria bacterium]|nr:hypothetical protein [Candidatus Eisenbacteria bacterium]
MIVDRTGLEPGDYSGQVTVTSAGADPGAVTVLMTVLEGPVLSLNTDLIQFGCDTNERTFTISNGGSGTLRWTVAGDQPWITADPDTGSTAEETDEITVTVDRTGMDPGDYSGVITVSPDVGEPQEVAVEICVREAPVLEVDPETLEFGSEETELVLIITNAGTGRLSWSVAEGETWLAVSPDSGSTAAETDEVAVTVDRNGLGAGDYTASIIITPNLGDPREVSVAMSVVDAPYSTSDGTVVIPADESNVIAGYESDGTLTLNGAVDYAEVIDPGDIVIGQDDEAAPNGFLRRVTAKTVQGEMVVLATEPAAMTEAFVGMEIWETHPLRPSDIKSTWLRQGCTLRNAKVDEAFQVGLACVLFDQDGDHNTTDDQIKLLGDYAFTADLFAGIEISSYALQRFECGIETESDVDLGLIAGMGREFDEGAEFDLAEFQLNAIALGGGGLARAGALPEGPCERRSDSVV